MDDLTTQIRLNCFGKILFPSIRSVSPTTTIEDRGCGAVKEAVIAIGSRSSAAAKYERTNEPTDNIRSLEAYLESSYDRQPPKKGINVAHFVKRFVNCWIGPVEDKMIRTYLNNC
jgi:hypothetical protein